jgi:hypothetical protein
MVIEHILGNVEKPAVCLLNLSNILKARIGDHNSHAIAAPAEARALMGRMLNGGDSTIEALAEMGAKGALMWCPEKKDDVGRVCAALAQSIGSGIKTRATFVIPLDPRPGCHRVDQFTDTWSHELLTGKWQPFISSIKFSVEPVKIVLSGLHSPMHHVKSLCLVTLSSPGDDLLRGTMSSIGSLGAVDGHTLVLIDICEKTS